MKIIIFIIGALFPLFSLAKEVKLDFEKAEDYYKEYQFVKGISGKALDLSSNAYYRSGLKMEQIDSTSISGSFTVGIWVHSESSDNGYKPLITNKKSLDPKDRGFVLATQENGSWMVAFTNGVNWQWDYKPTVARQPINDGKWHYLAITHNAPKDEMKMYYDGKNVATYCTNGNTNLASNYPFWIGNLTEGEWNSFNGQLDNFLFCDRVLSREEIEKEYVSLANKTVYPKLRKHIETMKLMGFNIFHGGHELGQEVGVERVIEVIKESKAEVIGIIETYGSGAIIADALGYYLYLRSSNLSIMSKYPIVETYDISQSFNCSAATIQISQDQTINYVNLWLDYMPNTDQAIRERQPVEQIIGDEQKTRAKELRTILKELEPLMDRNIPLFVSGDFNIASHLDWIEEAKDIHQGYMIEWPTSKLMIEAGFKDSYRELFPDPVKHQCLTWSPMSKLDLQYRIDFIYYKGNSVQATDSKMIDYHPVRFPSDHAAMISTFKFK